ncbi:MAG: hypothetical protein PGN12_06290 [Sphingomonas phyllosphaerae]
MTEASPIDDRALDSLSVAPADEKAGASRNARQDAGQDRSIEKRLAKHPASDDARLDEGLDETMDASDPVSITQPGRGEPAPSSGFDAAEEAERQRDA